MLTDHKRALIIAFFEAADFDRDGFITAEDIDDVYSISSGTCKECNECVHTIYYEKSKRSTLDELCAMNEASHVQQ